MDYLQFILEKVKPYLHRLEGRKLDVEAFKATGAFVIRKALPDDAIVSWKAHWNAFYDEVAESREINEFNPVDFLAEIPENLKDLYRHPAILKHLETTIGQNIGLFNSKLLIKDARSAGPVFLHQDFAYQHGTPEKITGFLALENATTESGVVKFQLGTHHLGYLGDAGHIRDEILPKNWPMLHTDLEPGDLVLMNCMLWHNSPENRSGKPRVILAATYQDADDFSTSEVLRGTCQWSESDTMGKPEIGSLFSRSRVSRLKELQAIANRKD